ncbi:MAG: CBS domain-containing protein [Hyphomicrobiaceae bacterium]|nr:CBS domain-containing protein [Hyphomicrobiaceae bacterium]MCC0024709.1 CBS domain-containing protein [Hyphomicrobiaceae bacterium]
MNVMTILERKGNAVVTLETGAKVSDAVTLLRQHNIGALVVLDPSGAVAGITSERDVVRLLADSGSGSLDRPIEACMTAEPYVAAKDTSVDELMSMMTQHRVRHLPVVEGGRLAGIISIGDVVKLKIEATEADRAALMDYIAG